MSLSAICKWGAGDSVVGFRPRFFLDASAESVADLSGSEFPLGPADTHHAVNVLRLGQGEECEVVVGPHVYLAALHRTGGVASVRLVEKLSGKEAGARYRYQVGLVQALTKPALLDYVIEKGTEVGASFFILVRSSGSPSSRSAANEARLDRWRRIAVEAAKQSKQTAVPRVELAGSPDETLRFLSERGALSVVLDPAAAWTLGERLRSAVDGKTGHSTTALWVGPEGGWSAAERERFARAGLGLAGLGQSVLRAETAGPVAVAIARFVLNDW